MAEANVFRCPHCLFLLRLPEEQITQIPLKDNEQVSGIQSIKSSKKLGLKAGDSEAKVGDFFVEHGQVKLVAKIGLEDKEFYLSWENWASRDFNCNIISGMNEIICKEFNPKMDWVERTCSGFILRDVLGWFSKPSIDQGIFLLDLIQFENWCKIVLEDIQQIKEIIATHPEIQVESDNLIDFEFIVDVQYKPPIDTTDRNKLDQRLLEDAVRYLQFLRNRPYSKISIDRKLEIPRTPLETSVFLTTAKSSESIETLPAILPKKQEELPIATVKRQDSVISSIENPYTGQTVELPTPATTEADIGTARTLVIPKGSKSKSRAQKLPKIEIPTQKATSIPQKETPKIKLRCNSCQKWFEVEKFSQFPCPDCNLLLKLAIQCEECKNWFSVSKPGKYNCPKCNAVIDNSNY